VRVVAPIVVGYQSTRISTGPEQVAASRERLAGFVARQGWKLGQVFVDDNANTPQAAYLDAILAARDPQVAGVVVPSLRDLAGDPVAAWSLRDRMEREAGVGVVVTEPGEAVGVRHGAEITFEALTVAGRAVPVLVRLLRDVVDVRIADRRVGVLTRERLRGWLAVPVGPLSVDEVVFEAAPGQEVALTVADGRSDGPGALLVDRWHLAPRTVMTLRAWI
jgi:hypothetical protein